MKTTAEKIDEKKKTLDEIETTLKMSVELYQITTSQYGKLYSNNKGKVNAQHITGISSLLNRINELYQTRNSIQNEINALLELEESLNADVNSDRIKGSKADILKLMEGEKK